MHRIRAWILPALLFIGAHSHPPHHIRGRPSAQLSTLNLQNDLSPHKSSHHHRGPRALHFLKLHDPLDCLSQIVCGMNTYPPQKPSVRTSTANDFAFLLRNSIAKLRSQTQPKTTTTTTTTVAPATKRTSTTKAPVKDSEEDDYDDDDYEADDVEEYYDHDDRPHPGGKRPRSYSIFNKRRGEAKKKGLGKKELERLSKFENLPFTKKSAGKKNKPYRKAPPKTPKPLTPLEKLRMEKDLTRKLLSDAQCVNGLQDHSCPFNYQQMLVLISSALERERTVSYTTNKVLPMVGYLIKSRNYTGSLQASFSAIEKINNYTIEADREGKPIDFTHILDEVMNRVTGDTGLRIVDTSNDSASASVWEDDEFDHVLQNPYERRRPQSDNYKLDEKKKDELEKRKNEALKKLLRPKLKEGATTSTTRRPQSANDDDASTTSEEDTSEEGLVFDRSREPDDDGPGYGPESSSEEDEVKEEKEVKKKKKITGTGFGGKKSLVPGPVFGFSHLKKVQKNAEDE